MTGHPNSEDGLTLIEVLVAMVLLFVGVALALRLQSNLESKLSVHALDDAVFLADSLLVKYDNSHVVSDTQFTLVHPDRKLRSLIEISDSAGLRRYRISILAGVRDEPIHHLYREREIQGK